MSKISELYGSKVFNDKVMRERLPKQTYKALKESVDTNKELTMDVANVVAAEMKNWAIENGATHFAHWFLPLTGVNAETLVGGGAGTNFQKRIGKMAAWIGKKAFSIVTGGVGKILLSTTAGQKLKQALDNAKKAINKAAGRQ